MDYPTPWPIVHSLAPRSLLSTLKQETGGEVCVRRTEQLELQRQEKGAFVLVGFFDYQGAVGIPEFLEGGSWLKGKLSVTVEYL
jgi:hypothetical protein